MLRTAAVYVAGDLESGEDLTFVVAARMSTRSTTTVTQRGPAIQ